MATRSSIRDFNHSLVIFSPPFIPTRPFPIHVPHQSLYLNSSQIHASPYASYLQIRGPREVVVVVINLRIMWGPCELPWVHSCYPSSRIPGLEAFLFLTRFEHSLSRGFPLCAAHRRHHLSASLWLEKNVFLSSSAKSNSGN